MQRRKSGVEAADNKTLWLLSKSSCGGRGQGEVMGGGGGVLYLSTSA